MCSQQLNTFHSCKLQLVSVALSTVVLHIQTTSKFLHYRLLPLRSLASEIPAVQVATAGTQVARESQPAQVWNKSVARSLVDLAPNVD